MRRSITFDNGSEFAALQTLEIALGFDVYCTNPHSPWQRANNEHTNRLVRQFAPKGTSFRELSGYKVAKFKRLLNDRPQTTQLSNPFRNHSNSLLMCDSNVTAFSRTKLITK